MSFIRAAAMTLVLFLAAVSPAAAQSVSHAPGSFVFAHGAKLWYESEGNGEPIVLIVGGPGSAHDYLHPEFSRLAGRYRVIYFDAFGRGRSDKAAKPSDYTFPRDVDDVEALRTALNLGRISVFGHSYGGIVAQAYALKYPGAVRSLILANTFISGEVWHATEDGIDHLIQDHFPETWEQIVVAQKQPASAARSAKIRALRDGIPGGMIYDYDPKVDAVFAARGAAFNPDVYDAIGPTLNRFDFRKSLNTLTCPILVLAGRADHVAPPRFTEQYRTYAPKAQFVMFEKSGHDIFIEETDRFVQVMTDFLARQ